MLQSKDLLLRFIFLLLIFLSQACKDYKTINLGESEYEIIVYDDGLKIKLLNGDTDICNIIHCERKGYFSDLLNTQKNLFRDDLRSASHKENTYYDFDDNFYRTEFLIGKYLVEPFTKHQSFIVTPLYYLEDQDLIKEKLLKEINDIENEKFDPEEAKTFDFENIGFQDFEPPAFNQQLFINLKGDRITQLQITK